MALTLEALRKRIELREEQALLNNIKTPFSVFFHFCITLKDSPKRIDYHSNLRLIYEWLKPIDIPEVPALKDFNHDILVGCKVPAIAHILMSQYKDLGYGKLEYNKKHRQLIQLLISEYIKHITGKDL